MSNKIDPQTLLANAPDTVQKDKCDFDWQTATISHSYDELKSKLGRPISTNPKRPTTIRLDADVLAYFKQDGKGWQTRLNNALREYIATH